MHVGPLTLDRSARRVTVGDAPVELTDTEYRILLALAEQPGRVLTHTMLLDRVWGPGYSSEVHYLRVYVNRLRTKIEPDRTSPRLLIWRSPSLWSFATRRAAGPATLAVRRRASPLRPTISSRS